MLSHAMAEQHSPLASPHQTTPGIYSAIAANQASVVHSEIWRCCKGVGRLARLYIV
ncbi:hypothetical protein BDV59DRAFT_173832 [Aspergillus ambiguus]|uniref:uncharacterized protein n=1 Tax=Aspergillus ambiguus TaxID=176160 RepID=UPI003CCD840D